MILGGRAHDFGKLPVETLAAKVSAKGYSYVQLALAKALEGIDSSLGRLSPGMANYIRDTLKKENVQIVVLGCYINPVHPDIEVRRKHLERFKEHIRFAEDFGCRIIGTETGSINIDKHCKNNNENCKNSNESEELFDTLLESLKELVQEAEKFGVFVGIEGGKNEVVTTPERMKRVLDRIDSNNLQVIYDPVNYLSADNYEAQDEIIEKAFNLFGDRMVVLHAKDFIIEDGKFKTTAPGTGELNYGLIMKLLKKRKPFINISIEDIKEADMDNSINFITEVYNRA